MREQVRVSVIIPVYNVYEWLDQCMESVVGQTLSDFEVILVDDGSTDGSGEKCREWEKRDGRVKVISKENQGPSIARNRGMSEAAGEYLVFIDADDWVDAAFLEKLYRAADENDAAVSECDIYRFHNDTGRMTYCSCSGPMGLDYTLEEHMKYGNTAVWKCMFRKSLFADNGIVFPDCHSEARAVYALLLALAGKVVNVKEGLYYYRRFRRGSLTEKPRINHGDENAVGLRAFDCLLQGFRRCGLYDRYRGLLQELVISKLSDLLAAFFYRRERSEFLELARRYDLYIRERFPQGGQFSYMTVGGYNLNRILWHLGALHNPYTRFNFSSMISLMHAVEGEFSCSHDNRYREIMLERDIASSFWEILRETEPEYIFLDFIEERFDVIEYGGGFLTGSDAFEGARGKPEHYRLIPRESRECRELWEKSFQEFVEKTKRISPKCRIIVIENYLSEEVGDIHGRESYSQIDEIRRMNGILREYYSFAEKRYEDISFVRAWECDYYYTDREYEYGAVPSHLNEIVNVEIAGKIAEVVGL